MTISPEMAVVIASLISATAALMVSLVKTFHKQVVYFVRQAASHRIRTPDQSSSLGTSQQPAPPSQPQTPPPLSAASIVVEFEYGERPESSAA